MSRNFERVCSRYCTTTEIDGKEHCKKLMDVAYISDEERAEYLAYHSYVDVINNFEKGMEKEI